jgi:hypothetical protein
MSDQTGLFIIIASLSSAVSLKVYLGLRDLSVSLDIQASLILQAQAAGPSLSVPFSALLPQR